MMAPLTALFVVEVGKVMDIITNSLCSDRDVFLRELVSNAFDACDKKRFLSITAADNSDSDNAQQGGATLARPEIKIKCNPDNNTITIEDSGVGMTREEMIANLGRIAQSGTKNFEGLMPRWLKFVRGVDDSGDDLPLNVTREILQKSKVLTIISKRLVRKSLDMIREIADDEDKSKYVMFWKKFGKYLKNARMSPVLEKLTSKGYEVLFATEPLDE